MKTFMKRFVQFLLFTWCTTLFADKYEVKLTYSNYIPSLEIKRFNDAGAQIATVTYNFSFTADKLKQTTIICKTSAVDWAPLEKVNGDPKLAADGLGVRIDGALLWLRNNIKNDGLVISGETNSHFVITANRIILGNNQYTYLQGGLMICPLKDKPTIMVRGEVVIDGDCIVNSQRLYIDKDARWTIRGALLGKFTELKTWRRSAVQIIRLGAPELISFQNIGTWVCQGDFIAPKAAVKNVECDNSKVRDVASTLGQLVVDGHCQVVSLVKETIVGKQRNITTQLLEQYGSEKRDGKTFLADIEVERIRNQMLNLVGRRLLPGFTNEDDQLWQFYKNTVEEHHRLKVEDKLVMQLGHLTKEVWEHLKKDIVWLQEVTINGEKLLTLVWFPCKATLQSLHVAPAMVVAGELNFTADGNWVNQGLIEATKGDVTINVSGVAQNEGGALISRSGAVNMQTGVGIISTNGLIQGATGVHLMAPLIVAQTEVVRSGNDAVFHSVTGGDMEIKSGGDITIEAGSRLVLSGSRISADGDITLSSGDSIQVVPSVLEYRSSGGDGSSTYDIHGRHGIFSYITAQNIFVNTNGEVIFEAPRINARRDFTLVSHRGVQIIPFIESEYAHYTWESSGWFSDASGSTTDLQEHLIRPEISAGRKLHIRAHDNLDTVALSAKSQQTELISETGEVRLKAGRERSYYQEEYEDSGFITATAHNEGYNNIAVIEPIMVHDDVRVIGRLMTEVKKGRLAPWVVDLCAMYEVDLREVLETHEQWYHHTTQMSMPLRTFLVVALTIYTGGKIATFVSDSLTGVPTVVAKSVGAAMEGITNTFIVSSIANGGDLGKVFKELTDRRYLKGLVASAIAAGLVSKFVDKPIVDKAKLAKDEKVLGAIAEAEKAGKSAVGIELAAESAAVKGLDFTTRLGRNLRAAALTTGVSTAISGGKVGRDLASRMAGAVIETGAVQIAHEVGEANANGRLGEVTHKVVHGATQALAVGLQGGDPLSGAIGAIIGETVGEIFLERRTQAALQETFEQAQVMHDMGQTLSNEEFNELFAERLHMHQDGLSPAQIGQLAASGTAFVGRLSVSDTHCSAQIVTENNLSVWGGVKVAGKVVGRAIGPVGYALTLGEILQLAYKYYQAYCEKDEETKSEVSREVATEIIWDVTTPKAIKGVGKVLKKSTYIFNDFIKSLASSKQIAFAGESRIISRGMKASTKEVQEFTLTPYGGSGGGHHVHMKSAYKSEPKYNPKKALCLSNDEMKRLGIDHDLVSAEQRRLCEELKKSGKPMTREEQNRIAVQALQAGGASEQMARDIVARSQWNLKEKGIRHPTDMPWGKKDGK